MSFDPERFLIERTHRLACPAIIRFTNDVIILSDTPIDHAIERVTRNNHESLIAACFKNGGVRHSITGTKRTVLRTEANPSILGEIDGDEIVSSDNALVAHYIATAAQSNERN